MTKKYDWDQLRAPGQVMWVPGVTPKQVSKLVKSNVLRRLGPRALVVTAYVEETNQTFVALAYVPPTPVVEPTKAVVRESAQDRVRREAEERRREYDLAQSRRAAAERVDYERRVAELEPEDDEPYDVEDEEEQMPDEMPPEAE